MFDEQHKVFVVCRFRENVSEIDSLLHFNCIMGLGNESEIGSRIVLLQGSASYLLKKIRMLWTFICHRFWDFFEQS